MQSRSQTENHGHCSGNETSAQSRACWLYARLAQSVPVVVGKAYGHYVGKELYSVAYL